MSDSSKQTWTPDDARTTTKRIVRTHPVIDIHTHLFAPRFAAHNTGFLLWGIDELLDYHYLRAEVLRARVNDLAPSALLSMSKPDRADLIWRTLFRDRAPMSEACRGVTTTLQSLGLDPDADDLARIRSWFSAQDLEAHVDNVMRLAGVERITMTNEVFDERERNAWLTDDTLAHDPRFASVVRIDRILCQPTDALVELTALGYEAQNSGVRVFVSDWIERTGAVYVAASLPPINGTTLTPSDHGDSVLREAVLPALAQHGIPLALMIGVRRGVNPDLASAGDGAGPSDLQPLAELCAQAHRTETNLLVTTLAREDQHTLCVLARKFANLVPFGCWWFLNTPSLMGEITRMRLELLGTSFIPQHSDARVLEQLIYKWSHSREAIGRTLGDHFAELVNAGIEISEHDITREVDRLLRGNAADVARYGLRSA